MFPWKIIALVFMSRHLLLLGITKYPATLPGKINYIISHNHFLAVRKGHAIIYERLTLISGLIHIALYLLCAPLEHIINLTVTGRFINYKFTSAFPSQVK
jgi:hypothetical protein